LKLLFSRFVLGALALFSPAAFADEPKAYAEITSFTDLQARHTPGTVYFLDLDNTTLRPAGFFGSDPWFKELVGRVKEQGVEYEQWRQVLNTVVAAISNDTEFQLVDPTFRPFYDHVGPSGFIGLTARSKDFQRIITKKHLDDLGLVFKASDYFPKYEAIENLPGTLFAHESGVIIIGRLDKGEVLREFVKLHGQSIKRIVFVDDLPEHAQSVGLATQGMDILVESFHLRTIDEYLANYDATFRGRWSLEAFLRDYVFGKYKHLVAQYPAELALLAKIKDPKIFDTSIRFTEFRRGWKYKYTPTRVETVHNPILRKKMQEGTVSDAPMLIFTSGSMGVGKGFSVKSLMNSGIIDPSKYLIIDPDEIKAMIPEFKEFLAADPLRAARFVHTESGHIQEQLTELALKSGKNVIIDGSLGAYDWWRTEIPRLQAVYPRYTTAIITVSTDVETQEERIASRAQIEGRDIEEEIWRKNREEVEASVAKLRHLVDFQVQVENGARPKVTEAFIKGETQRLSYRPQLRSGDLFGSNALFTSFASKISIRSAANILTSKNPLFVMALPPVERFDAFFNSLSPSRDQLVCGGNAAALKVFIAAAKKHRIDTIYVGDPLSVDSADYSFVIDGDMAERADEIVGATVGTRFGNREADNIPHFFKMRAAQFPGCLDEPGCLEDLSGISSDRPLVSLGFQDFQSDQAVQLEQELRALLSEIDPTKYRLVLDVSDPRAEEIFDRVLSGRGVETVGVLFGTRRLIGRYTQHIYGGHLPASRKGFYDRLQDFMQKSRTGDLGHTEVTIASGLATNLAKRAYGTSGLSIFSGGSPLVAKVEVSLLGDRSSSGEIEPNSLNPDQTFVLDGLRSHNYSDRASLKAHLVQALQALPDGANLLLQSSERGFGAESELLQTLIEGRLSAKKFRVGYFVCPGHPLPQRPDLGFVVTSSKAGSLDVLDFAKSAGLPAIIFGLEPDEGERLRALLSASSPLEIIDDPSLAGSDKELLVSLFSKSKPVTRGEILKVQESRGNVTVRSSIPAEFLGEAASAAAAAEISRGIETMSDSQFVRSLLLGYRELSLLTDPSAENQNATGGDRIDLGSLHLVNGRHSLRLPVAKKGALITKVSVEIMGKESPEFDRSVEMSLLIKLLLQSRYEDFIKPQKPEVGDAVLSMRSFQELKAMVEAVAPSPDDLNTMLTYLNMMRIGKSDALISFLQKEAGITGYNHNQVLPIALNRFPELFPSYARLPADKQDIIRNIISSDFNMGQLIQGENTVVSLEPLRNLGKEELNLLLVTNIIKVAGARGHANIVGSSVITENVFGAFSDAFVELSKLSSGAEPRSVYERILQRKGRQLGIVGNTQTQLAAIKLNMMFRNYSPKEAVTILAGVEALPEDLRSAIVSNLLNEGYHNMFALPYYGPKLMEKSIAYFAKKGMSAEVARERGIRSGLPLIAKIFESVETVPGTGLHKVHAETLIDELPQLLERDLRTWHVTFDVDPVSGELLSRVKYAPHPKGATTEVPSCEKSVRDAGEMPL
jgi:dephospho-CoA kinase